MHTRGSQKMPVAFDTLAFSNKLKHAGVDPKIADAQSEATAGILSDLIDSHLATKQDVSLLRQEVKQDMAILKQEVKQDMLSLKMELSSLFFKMITSSIIILGALQTLFHFIK